MTKKQTEQREPTFSDDGKEVHLYPEDTLDAVVKEGKQAFHSFKREVIDRGQWNRAFNIRYHNPSGLVQLLKSRNTNMDIG